MKGELNKILKYIRSKKVSLQDVKNLKPPTQFFKPLSLTNLLQHFSSFFNLWISVFIYLPQFYSPKTTQASLTFLLFLIPTFTIFSYQVSLPWRPSKLRFCSKPSTVTSPEMFFPISDVAGPVLFMLSWVLCFLGNQLLSSAESSQRSATEGIVDF